VGDILSGVVFVFFGLGHLGLGTNPKSHFLAQAFLGY